MCPSSYQKHVTPGQSHYSESAMPKTSSAQMTQTSGWAAQSTQVGPELKVLLMGEDRSASVPRRPGMPRTQLDLMPQVPNSCVRC